MQKNPRVVDVPVEAMVRQARDRARQTGEAFEVALRTVLQSGAGRQLGGLREGPHGDKKAQRWQEDPARQRAQERKREQAEESKHAQEAAAWERFMQDELRELEKRKAGQLAELLGEALPGEPSAALERLAYEDQRQAEEGLVALMSAGKVYYKPLEELSPKDMADRIAANRLRTSWLKDRRDGWLARGPGASAW